MHLSCVDQPPSSFLALSLVARWTIQVSTLNLFLFLTPLASEFPQDICRPNLTLPAPPAGFAATAPSRTPGSTTFLESATITRLTSIQR